jgi:hypothetical protein
MRNSSSRQQQQAVQMQAPAQIVRRIDPSSAVGNAKESKELSRHKTSLQQHCESLMMSKSAAAVAN